MAAIADAIPFSNFCLKSVSRRGRPDIKTSADWRRCDYFESESRNRQESYEARFA
jgi:hypothetical protein